MLRALELANQEVHLDRSLYLDEDDDAVGSLFETDEPSPAEVAEAHDAVDTVDRCLRTLDSREREIIRRYFGFDGCAPMTLEEIGRDFGLTRERIRQLRDQGLTRLRDQFGETLFELSHN